MVSGGIPAIKFLSEEFVRICTKEHYKSHFRDKKLLATLTTKYIIAMIWQHWLLWKWRHIWQHWIQFVNKTSQINRFRSTTRYGKKIAVTGNTDGYNSDSASGNTDQLSTKRRKSIDLDQQPKLYLRASKWLQRP